MVKPSGLFDVVQSHLINTKQAYRDCTSMHYDYPATLDVADHVNPSNHSFPHCKKAGTQQIEIPFIIGSSYVDRCGDLDTGESCFGHWYGGRVQCSTCVSHRMVFIEVLERPNIRKGECLPLLTSNSHLFTRFVF